MSHMTFPDILYKIMGVWPNESCDLPLELCDIVMIQFCMMHGIACMTARLSIV